MNYKEILEAFGMTPAGEPKESHYSTYFPDYAVALAKELAHAQRMLVKLERMAQKRKPKALTWAFLIKGLSDEAE